MFCFCNQTRSLKGGSLPPATKLRQGNVFTPVCHSVHRGVSVPACTVGHMTLGVSVQRVSVWGGLCLRVSVWGGFCPGKSLSGGLCTGGLCVGGSLFGVSVHRGLCLGCLCPGGLCVGGSMSRGVSVQEISVRTHLCLGRSLLGRPPPGQRPLPDRDDPPPR